VASASEDETARIFRCAACAPLPELMKLAEKRITRELTPEERRMYLDVELPEAHPASIAIPPTK
jgi:hypothetical protein